VTVPAILVISLASVLAGSLILATPFTASLFHPAEHAEIDNGLHAEATSLPVDIKERFKTKQLAGDAEARSRSMRIDENFVDPMQHCEFCTRVEYTPGRQGLSGFAYESSRGIDLTGAKRVVFWAMGEESNEKIKFKIAGKPLDGPQDTADRRQDRVDNVTTDRRQDRVDNVTSRLGTIFESETFALTTQEVSLDNDWRKYEVDLTGVDLRDITLPFGFELSKGAGSQKQIFYMKGLTYDSEPAENPLATTAEALVVTPLSTEISGNATSGEAPMTVELGSNTTGGIEPYVDPRWEFGDDEEGEGANVSHTYSEPGEYNVTFTVADSGNQTASDSLIVLVTEPEVTPLSTEISGNATSGEAPMTVELGSNTTGGIEPYVDPRWEFGDDEEGEGANVSHTYSEPGEYNVTFTVADSGNQTASDSLIVLVTEPEAEPEQQQQQEVPTDGQNVTGNGDESSSDDDSSSSDDDSSSSDDCDDSYPDVCIPPPPPVLECDDIDEEDFEVQGSDPHGFDSNGDGVGCGAEDDSSSIVSGTDNDVQQGQQSETAQEGNSTQEEGNESP
jgi:PKD repeat protein